MNAPTESSLPGIAARSALASFLIVFLSGCEPPDPLAAIRQQQAAGNFSATVAPLSKLAVERPKDPEVNFLYGRALANSGQQGLATWSLREAMKHDEWREAAGLEISRAGLANLDYNEVIKASTVILAHDPDHTIALLYRAQAQAHWRKDPEAALADARRVLELDAERLEAYEPLILALIALERLAEAEEALAEAGRRLVATDAAASTLAWHCSTTAILAVDGGEVERARERWAQCLLEHPGDPTVVTNAVQFYDARAEWAKSLEVLRGAHEAAPDQRSFRMALADRLRMMGASAEGEALVREGTEAADPRRAASAWMDLANYRNAMGEHGAAADALERAIEIVRAFEEPHTQLLFHHADALVLAGRLEQALQVAEELSVPAQRQLIQGRVAQERGKPALALEHFDEALRVWPDNAFAHYYAALAAEQVGDFVRALEEYRYALRIEVGATDARTRAARLLIADHQPLRAYQLLFLQKQASPLEPAGEMLAFYLLGRVGKATYLQSELNAYAGRDPVRFPYALAEAARGVEKTAGPRAALKLLSDAPGIHLTDPRGAPSLRQLVRAAEAAGEPERAAEVIDAALASHPEAAVFHEIRGLHLELLAADPEQVRAAYQDALARNAKNPGALTGLGRLALEVEPAAALLLFDRAAAADPSDPEPKLGAARALRATGQLETASQRLDQLLVEHPYDAAAAREQTSLDLERRQVSTRTLDRARRGARFGGEPEDYDQLSRVYSELGQTERAKQASGRARLLESRRQSTSAS